MSEAQCGAVLPLGRNPGFRCASSGLQEWPKFVAVVTMKYIDYISNMEDSQINLLIEGRFLETILKASRFGVPRRPVRATSRGPEATAARHPGGAEPQASFRMIEYCKCAGPSGEKPPRLSAARAGSPCGERMQRLAIASACGRHWHAVLPGCASRRSIRPSVGGGNLKPRAQMRENECAV